MRIVTTLTTVLSIGSSLHCSLATVAAAQDDRASRAVIDVPLDTLAIRESVTRYRIELRPRDSAARYEGTWDIAQRFVLDAGRDAVLRAISYRGPFGAQYDTVVFDRRTLAPIWQHWETGRSRIALRFDGRHVHGTVTPRDSAPRVVDRTLASPVFLGSYWELVTQTLPLAHHYSIVVPFYQYETSTLERDTIAVEDVKRVRTPAGEHDVWVTTYRDPYVVVTYWIERRDRSILRWDTLQRRTGTLVRFVRVSEDPPAP